MQIQLLEALRNFVSALGSQSPVCYDMLLPILHISVDINNPNELNLLEDGVLVSCYSLLMFFVSLCKLDKSSIYIFVHTFIHFITCFAAVGSHHY